MSWVRIASSALAVLFLSGAALADGGVRMFRIDNDTATLVFKCDVLGMVPMEGSFTRFAAIISFDKSKPSAASAAVTVDARSITMENEAFLDDAKGPRFFDVANHPAFDFQSETASVEAPGVLAIKGTLTLRGIGRPVTLRVRYDMPLDGSQPTMRADAELDRSEFGMTDMALLSDEVDIEVRGNLEPITIPFRAWW